MPSLLSWLIPLDAVVLTLCFVAFRRRKSIYYSLLNRFPYPPGPPARSWITGSSADISVDTQWDRYTEWAKKYGDIVHFRTLNEHIVLVSDYDYAIELFEKRSNNYSERPFATMAELMGWNFVTGFRPYGEQWRVERRMYQQAFKPASVASYHGIQTQHVDMMLERFLVDPNDFRDHIRNLAGGLIMSVVYDYDIAPHHDAFVEMAGIAAERLGDATSAASIINIFPFLRFLPAWLPGCGFLRFAQETKVLTDKMLNEPLQVVEERIAKGEDIDCIAAGLLPTHKSPNGHVALKNVCGTSYAAGADTTVSAVATFIYAMANNYDVQSKAQEEIAAVVDDERLPSFEDRGSLPYVEAVYREVLRWQPVVPFCLFHAASNDDIYKGYHIPKGATMVPNIRGMTRDPKRYHDPDAFNPSRFLNEHGILNEDDMQFIFGFGRRICPGRHFASDTVWLSIARIFALFDIRRKKDAQGLEIPVDSGYTTGLLAHPLPFHCSITPRLDTTKVNHLLHAG